MHARTHAASAANGLWVGGTRQWHAAAAINTVIWVRPTRKRGVGVAARCMTCSSKNDAPTAAASAA